MRKIHIGVIDLKYTNGKQSVSTGDVATWLENKYGIMGAYVSTNINKIADEAAKSCAKAIEVKMTSGAVINPLAGLEQKIQTGTKKFISSQEVERVLAGNSPPVPTKAALMGINHRKKNPRTGVRRPSFIDTGLYESSIVAWTEE